MSIEIKTASMQPVRNTYSHIKRRFGDKPATRYQEATYDAQATDNFHYIPLWKPDKTLNDKSHTAVTMEDWYALRDPRQFYYGSYVQKRARMQDTTEHNYSFFEKRKLSQHIPDATRQKLVTAFLPQRHVEQTANLNFMFGSAYGYGTAITQACLYAATDRLGLAQYISRIGLLLDGNSGDSLIEAKQQWMDNQVWQGVRALCEEMLVQQDWFEILVAQALVCDTLVRVVYHDAFDDWLNDNGARDVVMLTEFMQDCLKEQSSWADSVCKTVVAENEANKELVTGWAEKWQEKALDAYQPVIDCIYADAAQEVAKRIREELGKRCKKIGIG